MRNKKSIKVISTVLLSFVICLSLTNSAFSATNNSKEPKIGSVLTIPGISLKPNTYVLDVKNCDVTGDKINDMVILAGTKEEPDALYSFENYVIVYDGSSKSYKLLSPGEFGGYQSTLFIGDFNGDKVPDMLVGAATGGSGGTYVYSVLTFANSKPSILFDQEKLSSGAQFEGRFKDGYKAEVKSLDTNKTVDIDIKDSKDVLQENEIYDKNGKILDNVEISTDGYGMVVPVDRDNDGVYEIEGYQRLWGFCHANTIAEAHSVWKFEKGSFKLKVLELTTSLLNEYY